MSWFDDMDKAMDQKPEQFGMVIDEMGNPVEAKKIRGDRLRDAAEPFWICPECNYTGPVHDHNVHAAGPPALDVERLRLAFVEHVVGHHGCDASCFADIERRYARLAREGSE